MQKQSAIDLANILYPSRDEEEHSESILDVPPEQRRLHTETYDYSIATLLDHMRDKHIYVPEFQRKPGVWTESQMSRLIESLIIQCPIPVIYLSQGNDERLAVIDGNQRLTAISRFVDNQFALRGLTTYPELDGSKFADLDSRFQRHILNRTLRCIVIAKDTHPQVKFDVFERLNTGATKLTPQELRHGIYHGPLMDLLTTIARAPEWRSILPHVRESRMRDEELVLRFLAFHHDFDSYAKPLQGFLNSFAEKNRALDVGRQDHYKTLAIETALGVKAVYGSLAFRLFDRTLKPVGPFNSALFDAEMLSVSRAPTKSIELSGAERKAFLKRLAGLFVSNENFLKSITQATSDQPAVKLRVETLAALIAPGD